MPSPNEISVPQLARLVGTPDAPILLDVRNDEHYAEDPRVIPGAIRRVARTAETSAVGASAGAAVPGIRPGR